MLIYPEINPVIFSFGPLKVHWYGLMYLLGFFVAWRIALARSKSSKSPVCQNQVEDLIIYSAFGVILGGRFGYVLFYNFDEWLADPLWLFRIWEGGMSFHGALLGILVGILFISIRDKINFFKLSDFIVVFIPLGLLLGRIGNFINSELYGMPTNGNWGVIFTKIDLIPRHPSMLYESFLEGLILFIILKNIYNKKPMIGKLSALFLIYYAFFRFLV